jgi:hypothetical protein
MRAFLGIILIVFSAICITLQIQFIDKSDDVTELLIVNDSLETVLHNQQLYIEKHKAAMNVLFTVYNPVPEQTDSDPLITASGRKVKHGDLAVSRDFLKSGFVIYGDSVYILLKVRVTDTMNSRYTNRVDFLHMYHKDMAKNIDEAIRLREQNGYIFK